MTPWIVRFWIAATLIATDLIAGQTFAAEHPRAPTTAELDDLLKPIPPKEPAEAVKTFEAIRGFQMQLVASEPDVTDPVAAAFDENGLLYVAEMIDYPDPPREGKPPLGRVRVLDDADGDGRYEKSWIFADTIRWPTGVVPWKQGVFVAAAPDIWYLKDEDGDHRADIREQVYTGFGVQNQQGTVNNLAWAFDNRIYGSGSTNGGEIRPGNQARAQTISIKGRDFRFDPATRRFETVSGREQFGNAFDDWGNRFLCSESSPGFHVVLPQEYLARNPYLAVESTIQELTFGPVHIFRTSPIEPWRMVRSSRRLAAGERNPAGAGLSHEVIDAAAGLTIYRGDAFPAELRGDIFVGCSQNNLIHHRKLLPKGVTYQSKRAEEKTEFVRSTDIWFRPVNCINAPDGTLYVTDMSREVIEAIHIPLDVVARLDLSSGRDRGRIYRLAPPGFRVPPRPRLAAATTQQLVQLLEHRGGWWRDTAQRLLYERQDRAAIEPLATLLRTSAFPQARLHALWTLQGLSALQPDDVIKGLADATPPIREHAIRLAEKFLDRPEVVSRVLALANDPEMRVRFQAAFTLGYLPGAESIRALAAIARRDGADHWMRTAILSSCPQTSGDLLLDLARDHKFAAGSSAPLLRQLAAILGATKDNKKIEAVCRVLAESASPAIDWRTSIVCSLGEGLRRGGSDFAILFPAADSAPRQLLSAQIEAAKSAVADIQRPVSQRRQALEVLRLAAYDQIADLAASLIAHDQPDELRAAAIQLLGSFSEPKIADLLLANWRDYGPALWSEVSRILVARPAWIERLLAQVEAGRIPADELAAALRGQLLHHPDQAIAARAHQLLGGESGARAEVIERYRQVLALRGDPAAGSKIYERECSACHQLGDRGAKLGPNLALTRNRTPEALLVHILDPNREVQPAYVQYVVVDDRGRTLTGLVTSETPNSLTLARERGASDTILKSNIEAISSTGRSMMPEGFERSLDPQAMANLLAFLLDIQYDIGTIPGQDMPGQER